MIITKGFGINQSIITKGYKKIILIHITFIRGIQSNISLIKTKVSMKKI